MPPQLLVRGRDCACPDFVIEFSMRYLSQFKESMSKRCHRCLLNQVASNGSFALLLVLESWPEPLHTALDQDLLIRMPAMMCYLCIACKEKPAAFVCPKCLYSVYCSRECQRSKPDQCKKADRTIKTYRDVAKLSIYRAAIDGEWDFVNRILTVLLRELPTRYYDDMALQLMYAPKITETIFKFIAHHGTHIPDNALMRLEAGSIEQKLHAFMAVIKSYGVDPVADTFKLPEMKVLIIVRRMVDKNEPAARTIQLQRWLEKIHEWDISMIRTGVIKPEDCDVTMWKP